MLLARARAVRTPFVYVAIGLPERLARLASPRMERLYASAWKAAAMLTYSDREAEAPGIGRPNTASMSPSSSCRSGWTSRRSGRPAGSRTSTSCRSGPILTATSMCWPRSPGRCPTRASSSSPLPIALRRWRTGRTISRSDRPAVRQMRSRMNAGASLRSLCVRTPIQVRRLSCSRRWPRQAGRGDPDGGDRDRVRARGRRQCAARGAGRPGSLRPRARRSLDPRRACTRPGAGGASIGRGGVYVATLRRTAPAGVDPCGRRTAASRGSARVTHRHVTGEPRPTLDTPRVPVTPRSGRPPRRIRVGA